MSEAKNSVRDGFDGKELMPPLQPAPANLGCPRTDPDLIALLERARDYMASLTPAEQRAMLDEQKRRWVAAEMAIGDEGTRALP